MVSIESQLLVRALSGDELALDRLLRPLLDPGYRLAYMMLRDRDAAEDAVQEAAVKSWRKLSRLHPDRDPLPWFLGFVANECRNARRSRWRRVQSLGDEDRTVDAADSSGHDPDLVRALARLPELDRLVVVMFYYLDMSLADISAATGARVAAVRSRLYRAVGTLKRHLGAGEVAR